MKINLFFGKKESIVKVLIVDDVEMNRSMLADMLPNYDVAEAVNGVEAVNLLRREGSEIDLVLLDIVMPGLDGIDVLQSMNEDGFIKDIPVIIISSDTNRDTIASAFALGATDFISRPFDEEIVSKRVSNAMMLHARQKRLIGLVGNQVYQAEQSMGMLIDVLANVVEFRNSECGNHVRNVRLLTRLFLEELCVQDPSCGFTESDITAISMASALHDIGKIAIPSGILNKPGKLTAEEFETMKHHSALGAEILERQPEYGDFPLMRLAKDICLWHHERWDGRGYPDGLSGNEIPMHAQVVALADVYDALTSARVYKGAYAHADAVRMIMDGECGAFSPKLLSCLEALADRLPDEMGRDRSMDAYREATRVTGEVLGRENVQVSDRTLHLLEMERIKRDMFSELGEEIQFEFTMRPMAVSISAYGADKLGLPVSIERPMLDAGVVEVMSVEDLSALSTMVRSTSPEHPVVSYDCQLNVGGERRWYRLLVRAEWSTDEPPRYCGAIGKATDIHDGKMEMDALVRKASCDGLTGLLNRATARENIEARLRERPNGLYAFMMLDLDHFKDANDLHGGHDFGDKVLKTFADRLRTAVRAGDIVCRMGGDEFAVFAEYKDLEDAVPNMVGRWFGAIRGDCDGFMITTSMGVALSRDVGMDYDVLFKAADTATYESKRAGKDRFTIYEPSMGGCDSSNVTPVESEAGNE